MVTSMRRGSVVVDLAAEQGGNCEKTEPGRAVDVDGVTVIGYTDLASRMALQASTLYAQNIVNLLEEMGGAESFAIDDANDIVRPMTVIKDGALTWPPPEAVPAPKPAPAPKAEPPPKKEPPAEVASAPGPQSPETGKRSLSHWLWMGAAGLALYGVGVGAPPSFLTHFTVFVLACIVGYHVIWSVTPALHTPLMSVTNAISGIIVLGGMLQIGGGTGSAAEILGLVAVFVAMINVSGGFLVTQRMLRMFRR
jgi:NAD(P) transhydrogenase subunit alpha